MKPYNAEERLTALGCAANKRDRAIHDHARVVATGVLCDRFTALVPVSRAVRLGLAGGCNGIPPLVGVVALGMEQRVPGRHLGLGRETNVEAVGLRGREMLGTARSSTVGVLPGFRQRTEVPLAKVAGGVALFLEQFRQRQFLRLHVAAVGEGNAVAIRMPAGDAAPAGRTANRRRGIKAVEFQPRLGHRIQVRRANGFVPVKPNVPPAKIIAHDEDDVGLFSGKATGQPDKEE